MATPLWRKCIAECIGTYFIVLFGTGSVACAITTGALNGLWQVAVVWGFGISLAIFATAGVSGAHLNPAVTFALCLTRPKDAPWLHFGPYVLSQLLGSVMASACVLAVFSNALEEYEDHNKIVRGEPESVATAAAFGEYFPNPGAGLGSGVIGPGGACAIEAFGTGILMFMILALTDSRNPARPPAGMAPFFIGFTVSVLISIFAPLTQAGWNPARDFGPRLIAAAAGWETVALPGPRNGFWAYIVGPMLGAPIGAVMYDHLIAPGLPPAAKDDIVERIQEAGADRGYVPTKGSWCADQGLLAQIVRDACAQACCPGSDNGSTCNAKAGVIESAACLEDCS